MAGDRLSRLKEGEGEGRIRMGEGKEGKSESFVSLILRDFTDINSNGAVTIFSSIFFLFENHQKLWSDICANTKKMYYIDGILL